MRTFWNGFFWGPPSHKRIAWIGALAGVVVLALAGFLGSVGRPLLAASVLLVGAAEFGWAVELLPSAACVTAGWLRVVRWLCALAGMVVALLAVALGVSITVWFGVGIAFTGALLALEMAPGGPANRPGRTVTGRSGEVVR